MDGPALRTSSGSRHHVRVPVQPSSDRIERARDCEIGRAGELLATLPAQLGERFRPRIPTMATEILREVQRAIPEYARPLEGPFGAVLTYGIRHAIGHAVDNVGQPVVLKQQWLTGFRYLGKVEFSEGRDITNLLRAYRIGGRIAWRHAVTFGREQGLRPDVLQVVGEAIFAYVEEISALSSEGFARARGRRQN